MQTNKNGYLYVLTRTGEPVWPIVERPVSPSTVPGERASATQPIPTRPPPFDRQGVSEDELIDFTPALRTAALEFVKPFQLGELYTPPLVFSEEGKRGTLTIPGAWGAGNWHTGAFDPETGCATPSRPRCRVSARPPARKGFQPRPRITRARLAWPATARTPGFICDPVLSAGPPIVKPPYGASRFDLKTGDLA